ncbi:GNAT family N-acetyltransferase [Georgenia alba]|uniref:GNAT family N-acetyltransferase n=1 Tax=Georgenia alba TaxID=2233858 RepID=A0ABW2QB04_9MICO
MTAPPLTVAPAEPGEFPVLGDIGVRAYRSAGYTDAGLNDEYADALRAVEERTTGGGTVLAARTGAGAVGSVTLAPAGTRWADLARTGEVEVRMLSVAPHAQGRGVGESLMRSAETWARDHGYQALVLSVVSSGGRSTPHRLYERLGYRRDPSRDYVGWWHPRPRMWFYELPLTGSR